MFYALCAFIIKFSVNKEQTFILNDPRVTIDKEIIKLGPRFGILRLLCSFRQALSASIIKSVVNKENRHYF